MSELEAVLTNRILLELTRQCGHLCRVWRQNTGAVLIRGRLVRFGPPGQADISGVLKGGYRLEIEVKRPGCRRHQRQEQRNFEHMMQSLGGIYILATTPDEAVAAVMAEAAKRGTT